MSKFLLMFLQNLVIAQNKVNVPTITAPPFAKSDHSSFDISLKTTANIPTANDIFNIALAARSMFLLTRLVSLPTAMNIVNIPTITAPPLAMSAHSSFDISFITIANMPIANDIFSSIAPALFMFSAVLPFTHLPKAAKNAAKIDISAIISPTAIALRFGFNSAIRFIALENSINVIPNVTINTDILPNSRPSRPLSLDVTATRAIINPVRTAIAATPLIKSFNGIFDNRYTEPAIIAIAIARLFIAFAFASRAFALMNLSVLFITPLNFSIAFAIPANGLVNVSAIPNAFLTRSNVAIIDPATNNSPTCISKPSKESYSFVPISLMKS